MGTMTTVDNTQDVLDSRDVIERVEELRAEWTEATGDDSTDYQLSEDDWSLGLGEDGAAEMTTLLELLDQIRGNGGDHQWEGAWYPVTLVRDSYFVDYARELAEDIGAVPSDASWPAYCIDWDRAARDLQVDYSAVDFDGVTYWVR